MAHWVTEIFAGAAGLPVEVYENTPPDELQFRLETMKAKSRETPVDYVNACLDTAKQVRIRDRHYPRDFNMTKAAEDC